MPIILLGREVLQLGQTLIENKNKNTRMLQKLENKSSFSCFTAKNL